MGSETKSPRIRAYRQRFMEIDQRIVSGMDRWSVPILRVALGVVFIWFGALKIIGTSPAAELVADTVYLVPPEFFIPVLGVWELLIGVLFLYRPLLRLAILLLFRACHRKPPKGGRRVWQLCPARTKPCKT